MKQDSIVANDADPVTFKMSARDEEHQQMAIQTAKIFDNNRKSQNGGTSTTSTGIAEAQHRVSFVNRDESLKVKDKEETLTCDESKGESIRTISTITSKDVHPRHVKPESIQRHRAANDRRRKAKQKKRSDWANVDNIEHNAPLGEVKPLGTNLDSSENSTEIKASDTTATSHTKEIAVPRAKNTRGKNKRNGKKRTQKSSHQKENAQWITLAPPTWQQPGIHNHDSELAMSSVSNHSGANTYYSGPTAHTAPPAFYPGDFGTVYYDAPQIYQSHAMYHGPPLPYGLNVSSATPSLTTEESSQSFSGSPMYGVGYGPLPGHPPPPFVPNIQSYMPFHHSGSEGARTYPPPHPNHSPERRRTSSPSSPSKKSLDSIRRGKKSPLLTLEEAKICSEVLAKTTEEMYFNSPSSQRVNNYGVPPFVFNPPNCPVLPPQTSHLTILEIISCAWERHRPFADGETFNIFAVLTQRLISNEQRIGFDACITRQVREVLLQVMLSPTAHYELCSGATFLSQALDVAAAQKKVPKERTLLLFLSLHFFLSPDLMAEIIWQNGDRMLHRVNGVLPLELLCCQMKHEVSLLQGATSQGSVVEPLKSQANVVELLNRGPNLSRLWPILHTMLKCQFDVTRMRAGQPYHFFNIAHACAELYLGNPETTNFVLELISLMYPAELYNVNDAGRLPVHVAIENGKSFEAIRLLTNECSFAIVAARDGKTRMNTMTLAIATESCDINLCYELLLTMSNRLEELLLH